ncbi:Pectin lyase fold/virulence factor [Pseudocohnilembus persalinus]|uniref:Pectin lyase fold/virulence factor n=1 Tax=Pseudocohnilembus persalinus TaxID=266149 RepID=A0A0V0R634_PSEPJ|nr:Pectin lyase fold/virulence factor [Pseudocohnilembus persalinus]|eukprot:KRX09931.1 Pectin lyase fold/virulence factor [Pseudocohnilembus persalinus]
MGNKAGAEIGVEVGVEVGVGEDNLESLGVKVNFDGGENVYGGFSEVRGCVFDQFSYQSFQVLSGQDFLFIGNQIINSISYEASFLFYDIYSLGFQENLMENNEIYGAAFIYIKRCVLDQDFKGNRFNRNIIKEDEFGDLYMQFQQIISISDDSTVECGMEGNLFENNVVYSMDRGSIYLIDPNLFTFSHNNFTENFGIDGGAIYIENLKGVIAVNKNIFINNEAKLQGGAIYFKDIQDNYYNRQKKIFDNKFLGNKANQGGAISIKGWDILLDLNDFFQSNKFENNIGYSQGGVIYVANGIYNYYNQVYQLNGKENEFRNNTAVSGPVFKFANLNANEDFIQNQREILEQNNVFEDNWGKYDNFLVENCTNDEYLDISTQECVPCQQGSFNYDIQNNFFQCQFCPDQAKCEGNYSGNFISFINYFLKIFLFDQQYVGISIEQGFWINQDYTEVYECRKNKYVCQGGKYQQDQCLKGYTGIQCQQSYTDIDIEPQKCQGDIEINTQNKKSEGDLEIQTKNNQSILQEILNNEEKKIEEKEQQINENEYKMEKELIQLNLSKFDYFEQNKQLKNILKLQKKYQINKMDELKRSGNKNEIVKKIDKENLSEISLEDMKSSKLQEQFIENQKE